MSSADQAYFEQLKQALGQRFRERFPGAPADLRSLSGPELSRFQEDLMESAQGRVSEKWFYTHIKSEHDRLPRVDVLNLLSRYLGYADWPAFKDAQAEQATDPRPFGCSRPRMVTPKVLWRLSGGLVVLTIFWLGWAWRQPKAVHTVCFVDAVLGTQIRDSSLRVWQLREGESPLLLSQDGAGCVIVQQQGEALRLAVQMPYYQPDTLLRRWRDLPEAETVLLRPDDLANMLRYFASQATEDRLRRRSQLDRMIAPEARIVRMDPQGDIGVEMFNKEEFIRFLMLPFLGPKRMQVWETRYDRGLLTYLRFTMIDPEN